ncbi:MFS transporter [Streptomyces caelestis]|uniref:MFS family permease n=1 Tax=Streptomyces caelestis TaxID=36816 RepID=A0A7W9LWM4_9ACTN|nr:MFS transporter [Streptomyces caelestis]MBB5798763.1 MFS family permease [Streptomyces caelestis]GGW78606.1 MFS transporter [Streptomyces caelestis]
MVSERVPPQQEPATTDSTAATNPEKHRPVMAWAVTLMLLGCTLIAYLDKAILGLVAQPAMADLGLSAAEFGSISSAAGLLGPAAALLYSFVADRLPIKATLFTLVVVWSLLQLPIFFAASGGLLLATRFILGAAEGPTGPVAHAAAYSWWPDERRGFPTALLTTGASLGKLLFAPLLALMIAAWSWEAGFLAVALLGFAWAPAWFFLGREGPYGQAGTGTVTQTGSRAPIGTILLTGTFVGYVAAFTASSMLVVVVLTWLPSYFQEALGFSAVTAGSLFGVPSISAMVFLYLYGGWSDRRLRKGATSRIVRGIWGGGLLALGGVFLAALPLVSGAVLPMALLMMGYGLAMTVHAVANPALVQIVPPGQRTSVLSIGVAVAGFLAAAGPWVTGVVLDAARSAGSLAEGYTNVFMLMGGIAIAGGALFALLVNPERDGAKVEAARVARAAR